MPVEDVWDFEDPDSWPEWSDGELEGIDDNELEDDLVAFRGEDFARLAMGWIKKPSSMPPIVIVDIDGHMMLGDGRGRVSVAYGVGIEKVPAVVLTKVS